MTAMREETNRNNISDKSIQKERMIHTRNALTTSTKLHVTTKTKTKCLSFLPTKATSNDVQGIEQQSGHTQTAPASNPLGHCKKIWTQRIPQNET